MPLPKEKSNKKEAKEKSSDKLRTSGDENKNGSRRYDRAKEMLQNDNQLRDCISLINALNTAQTYTPKLVATRADALAYLKKNHMSNDALEIEEVKI